MRHRLCQLPKIKCRFAAIDCERWDDRVGGKDAVIENLTVVLDDDTMADDTILADVNVAADALRADHASLFDEHVVADFHRHVRQLTSLLVKGGSQNNVFFDDHMLTEMEGGHVSSN